MKLKTDEPFVPYFIRDKIDQLQFLMAHASTLYDEVCEWYDRELKSYDPDAAMDMELFDPRTGPAIQEIDYFAVIEALSVLQTANEVSQQED